MKDIFKNKWFWIIVGVILLLIIGYYQGWFSKKADVTNPPLPKPDETPNTPPVTPVQVTDSVERVSGNREQIINQIISRIDNQPGRVLTKVRTELEKLDITKLNGINSVVSVATNKPKGEATLAKKNCSPNESLWNSMLDNAGISCCRVCGGVWSL